LPRLVQFETPRLQEIRPGSTVGDLAQRARGARRNSRAIVSQIAADAASILPHPVVNGRLRSLSLTPVGSRPKDASAFVEAEARRWQGVIEKLGA